MPRTRPVGDSEIRRHTDQTNVDIREGARQRRAHEGCDFGVARLLHRIVGVRAGGGWIRCAFFWHIFSSFTNPTAPRVYPMQPGAAHAAEKLQNFVRAR